MGQTAHRSGTDYLIATAVDAADPLIAGVAGKKIVIEHMWVGAGGALVEKVAGGDVTLVPTLPSNSFLGMQDLGLRQTAAATDIDFTGTNAVCVVYYRLVDA